jgi:ATP-dependent DNA helicase RecQ
MEMQLSPKEILKKYWGFDDFRSSQVAIIDDALQGKDVLALLPTGGGKSICFQVPGLASGKLTVVISPLIALMEDQVRNLKSRNIRAVAISSALTPRDNERLIQNASVGAYDFMYVSPERIQTSFFQEKFRHMPIGLLVIDEAHCISEWGHDFRPAYRNIRVLRELRPEVAIMALTATATSEVIQDIEEQLQLRHSSLHLSSFHRKNLRYEVIHTPNKLASVLAYCNGKEHLCGIVYCSTRKAVKDLLKVFLSNKISASIYHGGMSAEERSASLAKWMRGEVAVMIATNAFGMGIDKPNVRYVLHFDFPESLEAYVQEAGRGGRDGLPSRAIAFVEGNEKLLFHERTEHKFPALNLVKETFILLLNELRIAIGSGKNETYDIDLMAFAKTHDIPYIVLFNLLKILELSEELILDESTHHPAQIRINLQGLDLYNVQIAHPTTFPLLQLISRATSEDTSTKVNVNLELWARHLRSTLEDLEGQLDFLVRQGIIEYQPYSKLPKITFLKERRPDHHLQLSFESCEKRKQTYIKKSQAVLAYLESEQCRTKSILAYFNETSEDCGECDVCFRTKIESDQLETFILEALALPLSYTELCERVPIHKEDLKMLLRNMQLTQKIQLIEGKFYV